MPVLMASSRGILPIVVCAGSLAWPCGLGAQSTDVTLHYARRRTVSEGTGLDEGRSEATLESGTITIARGESEEAARRAAFSWQSRVQGGDTASECGFARGEASLEVALGLPVYRASFEGDVSAPSLGPAFAGVLHIAPTIESSAIVTLRGHEYVATRELVIEVGNATIPAILLEASGRSERTEGEDRLVAHWSDSLWFDEETGWVLRREQTEIVEGDETSFEERELTWVVEGPMLSGDAVSAAMEVHDCSDPRAPRTSPWLRVGAPVAGVIALGAVAGALRRRLAGEGR